MDVVGFFLPYPQNFVDCGLEKRPPYGDYRKFLLQVVAIYDAKLLDGVRGRAVFPMRADFLVGIPHAVFKNIFDVFNEYFVCVTHMQPLVFHIILS